MGERLTNVDFKAIESSYFAEHGSLGGLVQNFDKFANEIGQTIEENLFMKTHFPNKEGRAKAAKGGKGVKAVETVNPNPSIKGWDISVKFPNGFLSKPVFSRTNDTSRASLYPLHAMTTHSSYMGNLTLNINAEITALHTDGRTETKNTEVKGIVTGAVPIMLRSNKCQTNTRTITTKDLVYLGEDPSIKGGSLVIKGSNVYLEGNESVEFNVPLYHREYESTEVVRSTIISQSGGPFANSFQLTAKLMKKDGAIILDFSKSVKFEPISVPFQIFFRLMGMSDREILSTVLLSLSGTGADNKAGVTTPAKQQMVEKISTAMTRAVIGTTDRGDFSAIAYEADRVAVARFLIPLFAGKNESSQGLSPDAFLEELDRVFLPHMGMSADDRTSKLRYLGCEIIRRMLQVAAGTLEPTDRESLANKRVHQAPFQMAKILKKTFTAVVIKSIREALRTQLLQKSYDAIKPADLHRAIMGAVQSEKLRQALEKHISSGPVVSSSRPDMRQENQAKGPVGHTLERKNDLNVAVSLRTYSSPNVGAHKQTERADRLRRMHPTYMGFFCPFRSADTGAGVGTSKELALLTIVSNHEDSMLLEQKVREDPEVVPLESIRDLAVIETDSLASVFINGKWIGCCANPISLLHRYRMARREGLVHEHTTICYRPDRNQIAFSTDLGRLLRPMIIVYNNIAEYKQAAAEGTHVEFKQWIKYTPDHASKLYSGEMTFTDLRKEGVVEFLSPAEAENCFVAIDYAKFTTNANLVLEQYTHLEIPYTTMGLAALMAPYADHTQPVRTTYETNQARQTAGWFSMTPALAPDKNRICTTSVEMPLTMTASNSICRPDVRNILVAYLTDPNSMEDSAVLNDDISKNGVFSGHFYRTVDAEPEGSTSIELPPFGTNDVKNPKPREAYGKVGKDGVVVEGTRVVKGDILISRVTKTTSDRQVQLTDKSVSYKNKDEEGEVVQVWRSQTGDQPPVTLLLRTWRLIGEGDKGSSRSGNKFIVAERRADSDMPFLENGLRASIIINPHSTPSRMTIGQSIDGQACEIAARLGCLMDATAFTPVNLDEMQRRLVELGLRPNNKSRLYNGRTGAVYNSAVCVNITPQQWLQKFVLDDRYVAGSSGPTDATTGQPLDGKNVGGGLRYGEMENWCTTANGASACTNEIMRINSDARLVSVCNRCGYPAIDNPEKNKYECRTCGNLADISTLHTTRASNVFFQELRSAGADVKIYPKRYNYTASSDHEA
jgi:DNA-directed RNA polymerase II subunit RPB2